MRHENGYGSRNCLNLYDDVFVFGFSWHQTRLYCFLTIHTFARNLIHLFLRKWFHCREVTIWHSAIIRASNYPHILWRVIIHPYDNFNKCLLEIITRYQKCTVLLIAWFKMSLKCLLWYYCSWFIRQVYWYLTEVFFRYPGLINCTAVWHSKIRMHVICMITMDAPEPEEWGQNSNEKGKCFVEAHQTSSNLLRGFLF